MLNPEKFNDVENPVLRAYNRMKTALSVHEETGAEETEQYLEQFNENDRNAIAIMLVSYRRDPEGTLAYVRGVAHEATN